MDLLLSEEQRALRQRVRRLAEERLAPIAAEVDESHSLRPDVVHMLAEAGLFRLVIPREYEGEGISAVSICLTREELARISAHADSAFAMQGLGSYPIVNAGSEEQKRRYLPPIARGEAIATFALTEPEAGSDVAALRSTAVLDGDSYVLNGQKRFISNAGDAHTYVAFAKTDPSAGGRGISAFIISADTPGLIATQNIYLLAEHVIGEVRFQDCRVPRANLLGREGEGFRIAMRNLEVYRPSVGAAAVGMAQAAFEEAVRYVRRRVQFGKPLAEQDVVQYKLAEMATELDAARLLVYRAALLRDGGAERVTKEASMAKLFATEAAQRVIDQALQLHGGVGLIKGTVVERMYREVRALRIYEGTSEIQHIVIARQLLREFEAGG